MIETDRTAPPHWRRHRPPPEQGLRAPGSATGSSQQPAHL